VIADRPLARLFVPADHPIDAEPVAHRQSRFAHRAEVFTQHRTELASQVVPIAGVVERASTRVIAIDDEIVKQAVLHIRHHAGERPIPVAELCTIAGLSRSALISRFRNSLGHPPKDEISRVRLARAQELLRTTEEPIKAIATAMRFASAEELSRFFRNQTGRSPTQYRQGSGS